MFDKSLFAQALAGNRYKSWAAAMYGGQVRLGLVGHVEHRWGRMPGQSMAASHRAGSIIRQNEAAASGSRVQLP